MSSLEFSQNAQPGAEHSNERDLTDYGSYLVGDGITLEEINTRYDPVERAIRGYGIYTVHERDLGSFESMNQLQDWLEDASELSQARLCAWKLDTAPLSQLFEKLESEGLVPGLPVAHIVGNEASGYDSYSHERRIDTRKGAPGCYAPLESTGTHGYVTPTLQGICKERGRVQLEEVYLAVSRRFLADYLFDTDDADRSAAKFGADDWVLVGFEGESFVLMLPLQGTMLNVRVFNDGFNAQLTAHFAAPRKSFLLANRDHRDRWKKWYEAGSGLGADEAEQATARLEHTITILLADDPHSGQEEVKFS